MSYTDQNNFFAQAYRTGTDGWTHIPFSRRPHELTMHLPKGSMILDIGAGRGQTMLSLADLGFRVIGLENNSELVHKGNAELQAKGLEKKIRFLEGDVLNIPFADQSFDALVDVGLLHHLKPEDHTLYLSETARVLKQDGLFFVAVLSKNTPQYLNWKPASSDTQDFERDGVRYHFFDADELKALFEKDFEIKSLGYDAPHGKDDATFAILLLKKK
jgi:cyclopropane fatty-acyl-phospholipid synthase-like methyltransferase